ncbi:MAG TPA: ADP-ribosylglycohydrolase family protein [Elusimicrobiota bacterium]|nr:ADP-ribosylglycohydrolase family protein [Elusimicrobiota bacterium]
MATEDKLKGMLLGVALGDALGAPFERVKDQKGYTGKVVPFRHQSRYHGARDSAPGQITDDTEMTIALAGAVCAASGYSREAAVAAYLAWAGSKCPFMGRNTRALFAGVKTMRGYSGRWSRLYAKTSAETWSQSNGALMRCSPLAALPADRWRAEAVEDCVLTNPHAVCVGAELAYLVALRALLRGASVALAVKDAAEESKIPEVQKAIRAGAASEARDIRGADKGWVLHALYAAFYGLCQPGGAQERLDAVVRLGGDTDTNAAIAGALIGAERGAASMLAEERAGPNLRQVLACDTSAGAIARPPGYWAGRLPGLAASLAALPPRRGP